MCSYSKHRQQISEYCATILNCCIETGNHIIPKTRAKQSNKPYWNELVKNKRNDSLFWGRIRKDYGQPSHGIAADLMRKTKRDYH